MGDGTGVLPNLHELAGIRVEFARKVAAAIRRVDVSVTETWGMVVDSAIGAGVDERNVVSRVSCSVSTVHRWRMGHVAPAKEARAVIRNMLSDMLVTWADDMERRLHGIVPAAEVQPDLPGVEGDTVAPAP